MSRRLLAPLFPPDPGGLRLLAALRATVAAVLTFLLVVLLGRVVDVPNADRILGFAIALFIAATVRDGTPRQRVATIALAPFAAFASVAVATVLLEQPLAGACAVPAIMFAAAYGAARGPRYGALGTVALIGYILALVTRQPPDALPVRLLVLMLAAGSAGLVRGVLLPERPAAELGRLRRSIDADIAGVLDRIATALDHGGWTDLARGELQREVYRLGDAVMLAQLRVAVVQPRLRGEGNPWLHLLAIELAVERVARVALRDLDPPGERDALIDAIAAIKSSRQPLAASKAPLGAALALLDHLLREPPRAAPVAAAAPLPLRAAALRPAFQTAIAAGLASIGGEFVSPSRWYWAAFAAFVMFQGTRSRAESLVKGGQFVLGTAAGVLAGTLLATLLSGNDFVSLAMIVAAVFLAFQANVASYGVMVFWITVIIGLLFGMLGYFAPQLLLLRLEEAAAGAACGAIVACLVLVQSEKGATERAMAAFLGSLGLAADAAARALLNGRPDPGLAALVVTAEQRFRDLRAVTETAFRGQGSSRNEALRRRMLLLEGCEQWARELGKITLEAPALHDPALARSVRASIARIDANLPRLIERLNDPAASRLALAEQEEEELGPPPNDMPNQRAARLLLRIDGAIRHLLLR